jgi:hypothetical protein
MWTPLVQELFSLGVVYLTTDAMTSGRRAFRKVANLHSLVVTGPESAR